MKGNGNWIFPFLRVWKKADVEFSSPPDLTDGGECGGASMISSVDWAAQGVVTPVKRRGQCACLWEHACLHRSQSIFSGLSEAS